MQQCFLTIPYFLMILLDSLIPFKPGSFDPGRPDRLILLTPDQTILREAGQMIRGQMCSLALAEALGMRCPPLAAPLA